MDMSLSRLRVMVKDKEDWHAAIHAESDVTEQLNNNKEKGFYVASLQIILF